MNLRLEVFGVVLYLSLHKAEEPTVDPIPTTPDNVPTPIVTYAGEMSDPLGFHLQTESKEAK